jgi:hypothetical protein
MHFTETSMALTSFNIDKRMEATLDTLKVHYGSASKAEVIRKAIALLHVVSQQEHADGSVIFRTPDGKDMKLLVR